MLVFDGKCRFALRGRIVVLGSVLQRWPRVMVTAAARGSGVADAHAFEHPGRICRHLQALDGIEIFTGLRAKLPCQSHRALGEQVAQTTAVCCRFNQFEYCAIIAKGESTTGTVLR